MLTLCLLAFPVLSMLIKPAVRRSPIRLIDPDNPCGPVAVAMVTHLIGEPVSLETTRAEIDTDPLGRCSMAQIIDCLRSHDLEAAGVKLGRSSIEGLKPSSIMILYVDEPHFVVARPLGGRQVLLFDPPRRPVRVAIDSLPYQWDGLAVLVTRTRSELRSELNNLGISATAQVPY